MRRSPAAPTSPRSAGTWPGTSSFALGPSKGPPAGPAGGGAQPAAAGDRTFSPQAQRGSLGNRRPAGLGQSSTDSGPHVTAARAMARPTPRSESAATTDTSHAISPSSCSHSRSIAVGSASACVVNDAASSWFLAREGPRATQSDPERPRATQSGPERPRAGPFVRRAAQRRGNEPCAHWRSRVAFPLTARRGRGSARAGALRAPNQTYKEAGRARRRDGQQRHHRIASRSACLDKKGSQLGRNADFAF
jgi:hypothetical protein